MWRMTLAVSSASLLVVLVAFLVTDAEGSERVAAYSLGCSCRTVRVIAIADTPDMAFVGPQLFTEALQRFSREHQTSFAFSPGNEATIVTLFDPEHNFTIGGRRLREQLQSSGTGGAAAFSNAVSPGSRPSLVPDGVSVVGEFSPNVQFDDIYPAVLLNPTAGPFDSGIYLLAGSATSDPTQIMNLFTQNGMDIKSLAVRPVGGIGTGLRSVYGVAVAGFAVIAVLAGLLVTQVAASFERDRLLAAAALGATRRDLGALVGRRLALPILAGIFLSFCLVSGVLAIARPLMLVSFGTEATLVAAATGTALAVWSGIVVLVSVQEVWRCRRVVPC